MRYFIVLLFFGIAWQYSLAAVLPIKPDSPSLSVSEKEENVQLDNILGPNLSEETITNPFLTHLDSLRTNEEPSVKENTEMFGNEDLKTESPPLSNSEKDEPLQWNIYDQRLDLSEETINSNVLMETARTTYIKRTQTDQSLPIWIFLKLIILIIGLFCWCANKRDTN
ncbi:uncharacterized protein LOC119547795 isoform X2 [Drosophila subpulchrella]|uniref:uncharacterized protein LOC119547795 isoform X2 n=1 Tax=Drosophila subpulchrella TaxID=1486046 RepID=UPI0018A12E3F|nr:uncharacterized protein LOC119547795 isoform X2 [Drosophila subpulchrella]